MDFEHYFRDELRYLKELGDLVAEESPALAEFLASSADDAAVRRLFEGFAALTGRLRQRIDDAFPEVTQPLLERVWPTTYRKSHTLSITEDFSEAVKGSKTLTVEQNQVIKIAGQQNNQVEGSRFLDVAGDNTLSVGNNIIITSKGGEVIIGNAGGRIVIDPIGNIRLEGLSITLDNHSAGKPGPASRYLYSAQYLLTDKKTKEARAFEPYSLKTAAGQVVSGFTNQFGQTRRVFTETEDEVELAIYERKKQPTRKLFHVTHGEMMEQTFEFVDTEESL
ncbi:type VI secretion system baseplate subunit TssF [Serratia sp. (in: enterobacteria)]|uniref:type VI secretion system baseplate subunit TssF n=1 Tax=Serratia sp. (in: enterobacteria) TaxID=616 RepID=UPI00398A3D2A